MYICIWFCLNETSASTAVCIHADIIESTMEINSDNFLWMVNRFSKSEYIKINIYVPGFTAARSTFVKIPSYHQSPTSILLHPATTQL